MEAAAEMLADIPVDQKGKIARFLEGQGFKEEALEVATDKEHRFELALALGRLEIALELAREADVEHKWKTVGDAALAAWDLRLAEECFANARDLGSLLLLYSSSCDKAGLRELGTKAQEAGQHNVAFTCLWQIGDVDACLEVLLATNRTAEAALFAQTYVPSRCREVVVGWKQGLEKAGRGKVGRILGVPPAGRGDEEEEDVGDEEMFPEWEEYLRLEKEGGAHADLIDVNGASDDVPPAKAKAAPVEADVDEDGEDGEATPQTETEI